MRTTHPRVATFSLTIVLAAAFTATAACSTAQISPHAAPAAPTPAPLSFPAVLPALTAPSSGHSLQPLHGPPRWRHAVVEAAGVRQWIECAGTGAVTVVIIPGLGATHTMWSRVLPSLAREARTCIYDRPGLGSSPARHPHATVDAGNHADELWSLLSQLGATRRLIVVGHSYGGLVARAFVARHPTAVAGLLLVEGVAPYDELPPYWSEGGDLIDMSHSSSAAAALRRSAMPLVVEAAQDPDRSYWGGPPYRMGAAAVADWRAHQLAAAALSTDASFLIVRRSAHVIEYDRPAAVLAGARLLVNAARSGRAMPRCTLRAYGSQPLCRGPS